MKFRAALSEKVRIMKATDVSCMNAHNPMLDLTINEVNSEGTVSIIATVTGNQI